MVGCHARLGANLRGGYGISGSAQAGTGDRGRRERRRPQAGQGAYRCIVRVSQGFSCWQLSEAPPSRAPPRGRRIRCVTLLKSCSRRARKRMRRRPTCRSGACHLTARRPRRRPALLLAVRFVVEPALAIAPQRSLAHGSNARHAARQSRLSLSRRRARAMRSAATPSSLEST